jgi:outer membrane protein assembly factor BamB
MKRINKFRTLLHFALVALMMMSAVVMTAEAIRGRVVDEKGVGIEGVVVSEGFNVARSGRMGEFSLERSPRAKFVFISTPSGYEHIGPFYYKLEPAITSQTHSSSKEPHVHTSNGSGVHVETSSSNRTNVQKSSSKETHVHTSSGNGAHAEASTSNGSQLEILFPLRKTEKESNLFIHTGDTEESVYRDWMDIFKENIANNDYAFVLFNGDICYEPGLRLHAEHFTTDKLGVRIVYSVGNHDLVDGAYGEELFEQLFGPVWYSFNVGGVHFINTPVLTGDRKPSYNADDMYNWMRKDLESIPEGTPVVLFNHHLLGFEQKFKLKTETQELDLGKYNLKGYLHAHYHTNLYHKTDRGVAVMATMPPNKGGKDHSPSSFRVVEFDTLGNLATHLKYSPLRKHIAANAYLSAGGKVCNVVAAIYDTPSEVVEATMMIAGAEYQLTKNSSWNWSTSFAPNSEAKNIMRPAERLNPNLLNPVVIESKAIRHNDQPKLRVKFSDGSTVITLVNILEGANSTENRSSETEIAVESKHNQSSKKQMVTRDNTAKTSAAQKVAKSEIVKTTLEQPASITAAGQLKDKQHNTIVSTSQLGTDENAAISTTKNSPKIEWVKNLGGNIFMTSPLITENLVISATTDDNMALDAAISALDRVSGEIVWSLKTRNSVKNNLHLYNGVVFAADVEGIVYAIDAQSGELKWEKPLRQNIIQYPYTQGVVVSRGVVYAGQGYYLSALDAASGEVLWVNTHWRGDVATVANPIVDETNNILLTAAYWTGRFAHDATTGKLIWEKRDGDTRYADNSPVLFDGKFYYASPGFITEVDPMSGEELMKFKIDYRINSNSRPLVTEKYYITGTTDKGVVAYDRSNGYKELWNFKTNPALLYTAPYTKDFQMTVDGGVALKGNNLYFGANDGYIYCIDVRNGRFIWRINTGSPILGNLVIEGDTLYIADFAGNLWAVK